MIRIEIFFVLLAIAGVIIYCQKLIDRRIFKELDEVRQKVKEAVTKEELTAAWALLKKVYCYTGEQHREARSIETDIEQRLDSLKND